MFLFINSQLIITGILQLTWKYRGQKFVILCLKNSIFVVSNN